MIEKENKDKKSGIRPFTAPLIDVGDGSGDMLVPLHDEVLEALGMSEGDTVELTVENNAIIIRRP